MPGFEEVGMLNAMIWALACFGVVAADIALSMVLFSVLDAVSVLTGYPIDNLDIQWFQAAAQTASFLMALLWWRYLWPRSFMARRQSEHPLGGGGVETHRLRYRDRPGPAGGCWLRDRRRAVAVARGLGRL